MILTFIATIAKGRSESRRVSAQIADVARGSAIEAPAEIDTDQVLNHALRHLAWLGREDEVVRAALSQGWRQALSKYVPATFQQIG